MSEPLIQVEHLKKYFKLDRRRTLHAVDDVSFSIPRGKTLGLVGESGCGKTTVGRTLLNIYQPDGGDILFDGTSTLGLSKKERHALTGRMQMIFQDPYASLDPRKTVGAIIGEGLDIHHRCPDAKARQARILELLAMVGLNPEHASRLPHEFSGGQRQRVGIARALAVEPQFIVCDEAISALDVSIQAQVINLLVELQEKLGLTYLFIAHDLSMVRHISDHTAVMYLGQIVEQGETEELFTHPIHPYTVGLLAAAPEADPDYEASRPRSLLTGEVTSPINPAPGCRFASRCPYADDTCRAVTPPLTEAAPGHLVACHKAAERASK